MSDEYLEVEIDLSELGRKVGPYWMDSLWYQWRYGRYHHTMTFEEYRERYFNAAIAEKVWMDSPKTITAGTDGSIRIEAI